MKEFNPYLYKAKITKVYDGDTCTAIIDFGFHIQQTMRLRLAEIDAPEIRGKERPDGLKARDFLRQEQEAEREKYGECLTCSS